MRHVTSLSSSQRGQLPDKWVRASTITTYHKRLVSSSVSHKAAAPSNPASRKFAYSARAKAPALWSDRYKRLLNALKTARSVTKARAETPPQAPIRLKMKSYIQFITTPTADTPGTALYLHFDDKRYIIGNIHEGLQRAGLQIGARFFKAKDFFITGRTEWQTTGGLMGMILTIADAVESSTASRAEEHRLKEERRRAREVEESRRDKPLRIAGPMKKNPRDSEPVVEDRTVTLHGGPNLTHTLATARSFIFRKGTPIRVKEHHKEGQVDGRERSWEPTWADNRIQVWAMAIAPSNSHDQSTSTQTELRRRSLGESITGHRLTEAAVADQWSGHPNTPEDQSKQRQEICELVVNEMFSSSWRYDDLVETPLHEVKLPAAIFVRNQETKKLESYTGPMPNGTTPVPNINVLVRQPWPGALVDHLPPTKSSRVAMSYIFRNHRQRGKFKMDAAKALGIPPGPQWAALTKGEQVQGSNGEVITSDMVLEESKEGGGIAVVDLPTHEYVESLVNRPEWASEKVMVGVGAIVWILGPSVVKDERLSAFMNQHSKLKHVISSPDQCPNYLSMISAASSAIRHNLIDPTRYSIPVHNNALPSQIEEAHYGPEALAESRLPARRGLKIQLEPNFEIIDTDVIPHLNTAAVIERLPDEVRKLGQTAQQEVRSKAVRIETASQGLPSEDAEIVCLGTGSALPSQHRNVSATLLRVPGSGSYLLDCGENTLGQLKRIYTEEQLSEVLRDLKLIWISHLHADHHLGTTSVIKAWYEEVHGKDPTKRPHLSLKEALLAPGKVLGEGKRLFVVSTRKMMQWLEEYSSVEDYGYKQIVPLVSRPTNWKTPDRCTLEWNSLDVGFKTSKDSWVKFAMCEATGLTNLVAVHVSHCYDSQAVSLTFPTGFKFSYSGDCRPSRDFATTGKGTTVLLHEATFDDELQGDAKAKKHSTTSEAIGVGAAMGAKRVILTHFSQRYQKTPSMNSMDLLSVKLDDADPTEGVEEPIEGVEPSLQPAPASSLLNAGTEEVTQQPEDQAQPQPAPPTTTSTFVSLTNPPPKPQPIDMKVGVAFDYMRVRVRDIIHLETFNPALRELYKQEEEDARAKRAAKEAFSDDEAEVGEARPDSHKAKLAMKAEKVEVRRRNQEEKKARKKEEWEKRRREKLAKAESGYGQSGEVAKEGRDVRMGEAAAADNESESPGEEMEKARAVQ
ncbi:hypothetical protein N7G274_008398 [Stereocaulon virgatum]|uniref:ribonuclease Z n=1 Tax=Stereocaulon virgatum TaxID=373712 RepID=A0ABR4A0R2_9LECA